MMRSKVKKQTTFRLDSDLLQMLKAAAQKEHSSLNNYVETALMRLMYEQSNAETREAINEAHSGKTAGKVDMSSFDSFMDSINKF